MRRSFAKFTSNELRASPSTGVGIVALLSKRSKMMTTLKPIATHAMPPSMTLEVRMENTCASGHARITSRGALIPGLGACEHGRAFRLNPSESATAAYSAACTRSGAFEAVVSMVSPVDLARERAVLAPRLSFPSP